MSQSALGPDGDHDVPAEIFSDHMILRPPNRLRDRATKIASLNAPNEIDPVRRAESALDLLSNEFETWMSSEIEALEEARHIAAGSSDLADYAALFRTAHDIRGQAATLGYPLAGEIADGLCEMIERRSDGPPPQDLVDVHVDAIRAMVREGVRDRDDPVGAALVKRLGEMRGEFGAAPRGA